MIFVAFLNDFGSKWKIHVQDGTDIGIHFSSRVTGLSVLIDLPFTIDASTASR